jgi:hypothetical protein
MLRPSARKIWNPQFKKREKLQHDRDVIDNVQLIDDEPTYVQSLVGSLDSVNKLGPMDSFARRNDPKAN